MFVHWYDECVRLTGRWTRMKEDGKDYHRFVQAVAAYTTTSAPGSYFELAFAGKVAVLEFDLGYLAQPFPHLWISVDGGARMEVPVDRYLRIEAPEDGNHVVKVLYKGGMEQLPRWYMPMMGCVSFIGAKVEKPGVLPADERRIIEFIGDSITEGVLTDEDFAEDVPNKIDQLNRPYQDDNCATYAALTAERLNLRAMFQAYGAIGMTRSGCGGVPRCGLIYGYVCDGVEYTGEKPDIVLINHGANDRGASAEEYLMRYEEFIGMVRERAPEATIVCLSAFCGGFDAELGEFVEKYNQTHEKPVHYISSKGWVPLEPLHPLRDGHRIIADHLTPILKKIIER